MTGKQWDPTVLEDTGVLMVEVVEQRGPQVGYCAQLINHFLDDPTRLLHAMTEIPLRLEIAQST